MSLLRRQIFPLFAAAILLAIGIALGSGPLAGDDASGSPANLEDENAQLNDRVAALQGAALFDDSAAAAAAPRALKGALDGSSVTLIALPGVDDERIDATTSAVEQAGGEVAVTARLARDLVDPGKKTYVASVATSSADGLKDLGELGSDESYALMGALLGRAYVSHAADGAVLDDEATKIDSELQGAELVTLDGDLKRRGSLTIVLAPGVHGDDVGTEATVLISTSLINGIAAASDATVVVTPPTGTAAGGLLDSLTADETLADLPVSLLNVSDGANAQVATVLGLAAAVDGKPGSFGIDGSTVTLPPGMATDAD